MNIEGGKGLKKKLAIIMSAMLLMPGNLLAAEASSKLSQNEKVELNHSNKSEWSLVWSDEFDGTEIDHTKWGYDIGNWMKDSEGTAITPGWGNNEKEYYTDSKENSYVKDGKLVIKAKKEQVSDELGTYEYTSAKLKTKNLYSKKYGRYEIKAKMPTGKGLWPAIWMLPEDDKYGSWAASGEIDIAEGWGSRPNTVAGTIHYGESWPNNKFIGKEYTLPKQRGVDKWHTYALEWEPGEIRWYVDGELYETQNKWYSKGKDNAAKYSFPAPFDQEFYLIMNLAVGGNFDGDPDATTKFPSQMEIDYVRVYDLKKRDYREPVEPALEPVVLPDNAKQPLADGNLIYDNQYEQPVTDIAQSDIDLNPLYWNFVHLPDFGGSGSVSKDPINGVNFSKITIENPGTQLYSLQQIQNLSLGKGGKYKVSFDAKSTTARNMMVKVGAGASRGWAKYSNEETFMLSDQVQTYGFTFDMLNDTDLESRLEFNLGGNGTSPVWIGNVRVEDITGLPEDYDAAKQPLPDGNHVYNGTFDQGSMDRMTYWNFVTAGASANVSVNEANRELHVSIQDGGANPDAVQVNQKGMNFVKGNDYKATFKARADQLRTIQVDFRSQDGKTSFSGPQTIELTPTMEEKTVAFTMPDTVTDENGQFVFNFGGQTADVYLDDVRLIKTSDDVDYGNIDLFPLKNGSFNDGLNTWSNYIHYDASAQIIADNGEAKVAIGNEGNETWSVLLQQENMSLAKGVTYEVSFDARSTKPRDIEVTVENAQYNRYFDQKAALTDQMQSYTFDLKMPTDDLTAIKFQLGKSSSSPLGAHDVFIDNVVLKVKGMEPPVPETTKTAGIDNGTFDQGTDDWSAWWGDQWSGYAGGTMTSENGKLKVDITQVGGASYSPQVYQKDLLFQKGASYTVEFDASADRARKMNINIGKELTSDPWFISYAPTQTFDLTSEIKRYSFTFIMTEDTFSDGKIVFELGNIAGGNAATTVYLDNINISKN